MSPVGIISLIFSGRFVPHACTTIREGRAKTTTSQLFVFPLLHLLLFVINCYIFNYIYAVHSVLRLAYKNK